MNKKTEDRLVKESIEEVKALDIKHIQDLLEPGEKLTKDELSELNFLQDDVIEDEHGLVVTAIRLAIRKGYEEGKKAVKTLPKNVSRLWRS